jgi:ornithine cyclodeaminase/alanine dehydrogenase-like protein (mu-crystallin family)
VRILTDDDVWAAPPSLTVAAARETLAQLGRGELRAPARVRSKLGAIDYVFTAGALADGSSGFRAYRAGQDHVSGDQLVAVWEPDGRISGLVVGTALGEARTGALNAVAADLLARTEAHTLGLIGTGRQAWAHLWALTAVRPLHDIRVYSPNSQHRNAFAARARDELGLRAQVRDDATTAVRGADIVVLATRSATPVIDAADVAAGAHVTTIGPKAQSGHEIPTALVAKASVVTCDSPRQAAAYREPFFTDPTSLTPLADVLCGAAPGRKRPDDITVHCSVGLAGSEVLLAQRLINNRATTR